MTKKTPDEVAGSLLGTLDSLEEHCEEGEHEDPEFMDALNELVDECGACGRWCEASDMDEEQRCCSCQDDE